MQLEEERKSVKIIPQEIRILPIVKPKASRVAPATSSHTDERTNFNPLNSDRGMTFNEFMNALRIICPSAVVIGEMQDTR